MSLDIDWSLLLPTTSTSDNPLSTSLIASLNKQISSASRPSFIGPISITAFDFGTTGPEVEIKDVRDVWRAFDEGDDEEDGEGFGGREREEVFLDDENYEMISPLEGRYEFDEEEEEPQDRYEQERDYSHSHEHGSVYSIGSPRGSVAAVGLGVNPTLFSIPISANARSRRPPPQPPRHRVHRPSHHLSSPPPSPPARPHGIPNKPSSSIPSLQLHLHLKHTSNLTLTLLTSLQVNYPSTLFMSLPLKLSITGLTISADLICAYNGDKHRIHLCVVDEDEGGSGGNVPVGQRLLPNLQIESEIGHADAHVLRNVGKVERFIADAVRKTLVEELVWPNFHTIAL